jgi:outer membrane protein TolC
LVERSRALVETSEAQVHIVMHDEKKGAYEIGEQLDEETVPFPGGEQPLTAMWEEARARRLELQSLTESANSQRERAEVARAGYWPRLDGFADATYANPNTRYVPVQDAFKGTWDAGLQLTIVPNDMANAAPASRSFDAQAAKALADREAFFDGVRNEVAQAREDRRVAQASLETTRRGLTSAEESYRVRSSLFQHGRATAVELTDAETDLTRARLDAVNARIDLRITTVRLVHALGRDVTAVSGAPR